MIPGIRSIKDLDINGRRVFIRVDFNVPWDGTAITDDARIRAAVPTIRYVMENGGKAVLASHLGRPKGKPTPEFSLETIGLKLAELLGAEVILADNCIGDGPRKVIADLHDNQVALLENLRFHPEEEANDLAFAQSLAKLADVYINDAFGVSHRAHASVDALPRMMREKAAGFLVEQELRGLSKLVGNVAKPFVTVLGGAKVADKVPVIEALLDRINTLVIGGAMANTFLAALGLSMGKSRVEADRLPLARSILERAKSKNVEVLLPKDLVVASSLDAKKGHAIAASDVGPDDLALDIGPESVRAFAKPIALAKSVFWNGPMGLFENEAFRSGSAGIAKAIAESTGFSVIGGGDTASAAHVTGYTQRFGHVSTGGGASLEFIEGRKLPGIEALRA